MTGAILGDIAGSRFEFNNRKSKEFELFTHRCTFTDDSVMTVAVAEAFIRYNSLTEAERRTDLEKGYAELKRILVDSMHRIGRRYPDCGYGGHFYYWIMENRTEPYKSYGNGSAMRVSPVIWYANSLEEAETLAKVTAEVTHNHAEGIKGAQAVAGAGYLARTGASIVEIRKYVSKYYTIDFTLDEIRDGYSFYETCQDSVPQALEAFLESTGFENAVRNAISIGGDSDTIAAMTGAIAEAYYGIDAGLKETAESFLTYDLLSVYEKFNEMFRK